MTTSINQKAFNAYVALVTHALQQGVDEGLTTEALTIENVKVNTIERLKIEITSSDTLIVADGMCAGADGKTYHFHVIQDSNGTDVIFVKQG